MILFIQIDLPAIEQGIEEMTLVDEKLGRKAGDKTDGDKDNNF